MGGFGAVLKEWRRIRRMSQLDLALSAGVSARHVSFLETGRSRASRDMVLRLGQELQMPLSARNQLLLAAGLAPAYGAVSLNAEARAPLQQAVDWVLQRHAPYPAIVIDAHWILQAMNPPAQALMMRAGLQQGDSLIDALSENETLRAALVNLEQIEALTLTRLRSELAHLGKDPVLERAIAQLQQRVIPLSPPEMGETPAVIPAHYRLDGVDLKLFSTLSQFTTAGDLAMSELRLELMFPADQDTQQQLQALFGDPG
ncbi:helix-turn-helix domain-containing protein [Pseudophaeobacter sp.]|jgi:transcriptional regulator with XRE-family HTH domain|uniref:helix-turn-helix domain-containing protein n=1 Tax=Pseudophaeobacter sp. TaxID=1971739 RepID=UPI003A98247D